ncbi:MAG TPA: phosphoribosyltransferase family protein [Acidimicrobiales bacterium]|nr:phosphoribosyltransferase family protein [Acidimicrobiales bacterium]
MAFRDRADAGRVLAAGLGHLAGAEGLMVLGLPRGGVPVAHEVAGALHAPLDVFLARKLGVPRQPELAMGAVAAGGVIVLHHAVVDALSIPPSVIEAVAAREAAEVARRERAYRAGRPPLDVADRSVVVVDDGLATGSTMRAAVAALRARHAGRIVVAVPVGASATCRQLAGEADEVVCASMPASFHAVGQWYDDFTQTTDDEIRALLGTKEDHHGQ